MTNKLAILVLGLTSFAAFGNAQVDGHGDSEAKPDLCVECHSEEGNSANPLFPALAGQNAAYLAKQIEAFRKGSRQHPLITSTASNLSDTDIADFAAFYAGLTQKPTDIKLEISGPEIIEKGRSKYTPCTACHGVNGEGIAPYPKLAGQRPEYLQQQLMNFKNGARPNASMRDMAINLSEDDIEALVTYLATLE